MQKQYKTFANQIISLILMLLSMSYIPQAQASCNGCLCPGDPCRLCPLPAMISDIVADDDPETCKKIRQEVLPIDSQPGSNEYFASLDMATRSCVKNGGDVIKNSRRSDIFPSRYYCKPYLSAIRQQ